MGHIAKSNAEMVRYAALLRGTESAVQAISVSRPCARPAHEQELLITHRRSSTDWTAWRSWERLGASTSTSAYGRFRSRRPGQSSGILGQRETAAKEACEGWRSEPCRPRRRSATLAHRTVLYCVVGGAGTDGARGSARASWSHGVMPPPVLDPAAKLSPIRRLSNGRIRLRPARSTVPRARNDASGDDDDGGGGDDDGDGGDGVVGDASSKTSSAQRPVRCFARASLAATVLDSRRPRKYYLRCAPPSLRLRSHYLAAIFYGRTPLADVPHRSSPPHKRTKSVVGKALQRLSSRGDVPTLTAQQTTPGSDTMPDLSPLAQTGSARTSMQTSRPGVSTSAAPTNTQSGASLANSPTTHDAQSSATPAVTSTSHGPSIEQSVRLFKVFEALRSGDLAAIARATGEGHEGRLEGTTILHLAIQCAEVSVIEHILSAANTSPTDLNARDREGNTPLHIAAQLGRAPIVKLLLEKPTVNDAIHNYQGKTPLDLARNPDIFQQLQLARSVYIDTTVRRIHALVTSGQYDELEQLANEPRVKTTLDINGPELATDPAITESGGTLLHEAARKKDLKLAQILLLNGADPFRRDRKGKLPQDITKDEKTRAILKKSPAAQAAQRSIQEKTILGDGSQGAGTVPTDSMGPGGKESREMKGYLRKWTNYTSGYKLRWFVLEDGVLSYYKHQDDAGSACRGAINMRIAKLQMDLKDKLLFEIHGKSSVKYTLKANHQIEAKRWFWALNNAIQWSKDEAKEDKKRQQQETLAIRDAQLDRTRTRENEVIQQSKHTLIPGTAFDSAAAGITGASTSLAGSTVGDRVSAYEPSFDESRKVLSRTNTATIEGDIDDEDEYGDDASSHEVRPANRDAFSITAQSAKLQLDLLTQVSSALSLKTRAEPGLPLSDASVTQALTSYDTAVSNLKGLLGDLLKISKDHEAYWQYRIDREQNIRRLWEDSMARVAKEQEELENRIGESEDKRKRTKRALRDALVEGASTPHALETGKTAGERLPGQPGGPKINLPSPEMGISRRLTIAELTNNEISDDESEDEEEFFDAVDAGDVKVVETMPPTSPRALQDPENAIASALLSDNSGAQAGEAGKPSDDDDVATKATAIVKSYRGYEDGLRKRLKLDADNRPKVGLWGILKSMIGKDMTKMTLPVSFNEPTSLLYRVVEDMEYTDLLNVAAERMDSTERLVYVAGFAASEYASTIGRVAKPFNPLLGETYEYVRPDLGYRFFIEQVSHHPPVGAAFAESPHWDYYGESAVKSKFYGKSFEFNPLGTWFLHLRPKAGGPQELYTWKKVTSSVVGIITGNPVVDNYGPMEIKNWTTGEVCYLDFKPKGWKASSAFHVTGRVVDAQGRTRWSMGGRWNDKIYARLTPGYEAAVDAPTGNETADPNQAFLVWEAHQRPTGIPFNITPFVVTLNDPAPALLPFLPPTDSRLRPDQRAMEEGEYDFAAVEKNRVEEAQRARRKEREAKGEEFVPKWFEKANHPVTGEEYWDFNHKYWKIRDGVVQGQLKWQDQQLEQIFT
nr:oxysterol-binding protein like c2f12.05c [Quercus suber]